MLPVTSCKMLFSTTCNVNGSGILSSASSNRRMYSSYCQSVSNSSRSFCRRGPYVICRAHLISSGMISIATTSARSMTSSSPSPPPRPRRMVCLTSSGVTRMPYREDRKLTTSMAWMLASVRTPPAMSVWCSAETNSSSLTSADAPVGRWNFMVACS